MDQNRYELMPKLEQQIFSLQHVNFLDKWAKMDTIMLSFT